MSPVEFKKRPFRPVECKGQGPQLGVWGHGVSHSHDAYIHG